MATASFDKSFVVKDKATIRRFRADLKNARVIDVKPVDFTKNKEKGSELLNRFLSA